VNLSPIALASLLETCAPNSDPRIFASIAKVESTDPYDPNYFPNTNAIHDNLTGKSYYLKNTGDAIALAQTLVARGRGSVDLGVVQVNSSNLRAQGGSLQFSVADAFSPCTDLQMGEKILVSSWNTALAHVGVNGGIYPVMFATASVYNSNTLYKAQRYIGAFRDAYDSQYVKNVAYYVYAYRAQMYAMVHRLSNPARAALVGQALIASDLEAPPAQAIPLPQSSSFANVASDRSVSTAPPAPWWTDRSAASHLAHGARFEHHGRVTTQSKLSADGFDGVWH
jgi:hypothetical protein